MEVYLDNSATTKPYKEVVDSMVLALTDEYGNPSSAHRRGFNVEKKIKSIRQDIAKTLGARDKEIFFTSGGTESNNSIIRSIARQCRNKKHIITTSIEHPSVLKTMEELEKEGFDITYLKVDKRGIIDIETLKSSITEKTCLVSVMYVNNEIGCIEPIQEIGELLKSYPDVFFHVDAVQAYGKINFNVNKLGVDFLSVSGHKIHGPKGIGFMYIREPSKFNPLITGGGQEFGIRPGTENVPGIYGLGRAVNILFEDIDSKIFSIRENRDYLYKKLTERVDGISVNTDVDNSVCHILNVSFKDVKGEVLLHYLGDSGIYVSIGSACSSKKKGSHVLSEIGLSNEGIDGAIRFSLSDLNTKEEIDYTVGKVCEYVDTIRLFSGKKRG